MGFRYQRRIGKGLGLNLSKSGISTSYRTKYGSIGSKGFSLRTGIPGLTFRSRKSGDAALVAFAGMAVWFLICAGGLVVWNILLFTGWLMTETYHLFLRMCAPTEAVSANLVATRQFDADLERDTVAPDGAAASQSQGSDLNGNKECYNRGTILLSEVEYFPHNAYSGGCKIARNVEYLGVRARKSDGFHCISWRNPGSKRAYNAELGSVHRIVVGGREFHALPSMGVTWREQAAAFRSFIEQIPVSADDF